jgi:hypothetical protein
MPSLLQNLRGLEMATLGFGAIVARRPPWVRPRPDGSVPVAEGGWERVCVAKRLDSAGDHLGTTYSFFLLPRANLGTV